MKPATAETFLPPLEVTARQLAAQHQVTPAATSFPPYILDRLAPQAEFLQTAYQHFLHSEGTDTNYATAAEWIMDNFYVVRQAIRQIDQNLPPTYYEQLPKLNNAGDCHGFPRVYALAARYTVVEKGFIDVGRIKRFVLAYQEISSLTMGEVWALPTMLRFCLLECLVQSLERIMGLAATTEAPSPHFSISASAKEVVANCILGLRLLDSQNWPDFFEEVSQVEQILRQDPVGVYGRMTFKTRDQYRKVVETLAQATGQSEMDVAHKAVRLARSAFTPLAAGSDAEWAGLHHPPAEHIGYYLLGMGRERLERELGFRPSWLRRWWHLYAPAVYLGSIALLTLLLLALLAGYALTVGGEGWQLLLAAGLGIVPVTAVAVGLVNWGVTMLVKPHILPKLDFSQGVPATCRTMVVVPALLTSEAELHSLLSQLEQHYLRNPDPHLTYALLTDFADAPAPELPTDEALAQQITAGIQTLNQRYPDHPFYLFHRRRQYNPSEAIWMGWERKRGKLHEFNRLLRGAGDTSFVVQVGDLTILPHIQYVITLDADTILPADAAWRLIGTLAHPLNKARCDPQNGTIASGYSVLQPRTEIKPTSAGQSLFTRVFAGDIGLDLYSLAVSDVYQDLFGEGIYVGKGIYDVDAFECSLAGRVPENALLSHDLFEGIQGRAGLVTDIVLYEDFPSHYLIHVRRSHRWIRGDWQLLPWLGRAVPTGHGRQRNDLSFLDRWKIADNLRRSLVAPLLFLFFVAGWLWLPGSPAVWTITGLALTAVPLLTAMATALARGIGGASWGEVRRPIQDSGIRWLLQIAFLPYEGLLHLDALLLTLWRLYVSRRHLLRWTTAAHTTRLLGEGVTAEKIAGQMIRSLILVSVLLLLLIIGRPEALAAAVPLMLLWVLSAEIAYRISQPQREATAVLTAAERQRLHALARRTWLFFEEYVGPEDNWLPPDHYQENPRQVVAHRTSPTNIGLYLLTALGAYDLGYISLLNLSLRLNDTFETLAKLDRYRGHFLNWLDTRTLRSLPPRYVSTVDSGNLAGCLLALKQGCLAIKDQPALRPQRWQGVLDTLSLFNEAVAALPAPEQAAPIRADLARIQAQIESARPDPWRWAPCLANLMDTEMPHLEDELLSLFEDEANEFAVTTIYQWRHHMALLRDNVFGMQRELELLSPWLAALALPPPYFLAAGTPAPVRSAWQTLQAALPPLPRLGELIAVCRQAEEALQQLRAALPPATTSPEVAAAAAWCAHLQGKLANAQLTAEPLLTSYEILAQRAGKFVSEMDFTFLYNPQRHVFHIGYNLESSQLDNNYYDLLASEARIASLVAIAKRDVPQKHWLHLARPLTRLKGGLALLSWSGTMFEYLMPSLLMNSYRGTLLAQSCQAVVDHQIAYGHAHQVPWGISESGFYSFDNAMNHQYRAFGVPGTGFKRGLADDLVVAPYACLLALAVRPRAVISNLDHLLRYQMVGLYGLYEAIDFTPARLQLGQEAAVVRSYMSHHQGMIMLALANYLQDNVMVARFHAEPAIQSVELLLQEQVSTTAPLQTPHAVETTPQERPEKDRITAEPWAVPLETPVPLVHYLSNGRFGCLITNAGGGYLAMPDFALTRWRPDTTCDNWGIWLYLQDMERNHIWSAGLQPAGKEAPNQELRFFPHKVHFQRHDHDITLQMEITVAPETAAEIRLVQLTNDSEQTRRLRLTSYGEVVLTDFASDNRHPAFAKLFIESEYVPEHNALFFRRRPRSDEESPRFLGHMLVTAADTPRTGAYESDRARFLGRNHTPAHPLALQQPERWLSGTTGATLDPIMALGQEVELAPHTAVQLAWITFTADSRAELLSVAQKYQRWAFVRQAFVGARTQSEQELHQLNLPVAELAQVQKLLSLLLYTHDAKRADASILEANTAGQPALWAYGISGDYPILLLRLEQETNNELLPQLLRAHTYWRRRGLRIDLVLLNQQETHYGQPVQDKIFRTVRAFESEHWLNKRGGIFIVRADQMSQADKILLQTAARVILDAAAGPLVAQLDPLSERVPALPAFLPSTPPADNDKRMAPLPRPEGLLFDNSWGGFTPDGKEYIITLEPDAATPAPWVNVIANEDFGFLISETGGGYSWAANSGENRLTSWRNDPVSDGAAEALYLRDEETGAIWSPTPQPAPADAPYRVRHGAGYTIFEHNSHQLKQRLHLFTPIDAPVKIVRLYLENNLSQPRRITATYFAEWVLGSDRQVAQPYIISAYRPDWRALVARNPYNPEFGQHLAFLAASKEVHGFTGDRTEFLGRLGHLSRPAALGRIGLSDTTPMGADPAAAMQLHIDLPPKEGKEIYFLLGQGKDEKETAALITRFQDEGNVLAAWEAVQDFWNDVLGKIIVETPDPAMNLLLNRWLLYQALACRIWGRSALYQSSGAYGFRDQLQDVMAVIHARPDLARTHLLRAARHQFKAGDVLHWWHPPSGRGVRTRITDDLVWLPYVTAVYVTMTDDTAVLNEAVPFLTGAPLNQDEEERYGLYERTEAPYSLYEHCCRALEKAATQGPHGLPLMGAGDWNDGMNRVGIEGQGESVWLGWFLAGTLQAFAGLCQKQGDEARARHFRQQAEAYRVAIEAEAWDGSWYRRAYYDDGTPLGSRQNKECRLDAIAQSWAVLTELGNPEKVEQALTAVEKHLIKEEHGLILLFTPPFDQTRKDPGYIKGYLPGIRENGGQYTHAALWTIWAFAHLGEGEKAEALFRMINPVYRADTPEKAALYKVEPYVIAADVYGVPPHEGRGGWTWYTGSSGWMYRLGVEGILGLRREGNCLRVAPRIPDEWPGYRLSYRYGRALYHIMVERQAKGNGVQSVWVDGQKRARPEIPLLDDGREHQVRLLLGGEIKLPPA